MTHPTPGNSTAAAEATAREAELRYVNDGDAGIRRRRCGKGFTYLDRRGRTVRTAAVRKRIDELSIPPAWTEVWICPQADGHIQATGRDAEGRKQYIYHPRWRTRREREKYDRLGELGHRLPVLRQRVGRDLSSRSAARVRVVAGAVRVLDTAALRIGNEAYAQDNGSYGVTSLRERHVKVRGDRIRFSFTGKSGKETELELRDRELAELVRDLGGMPGEELFRFRDAEGEVRRITPEDVNDYMRDVTEADVSAKDFRTWSASVHVLRLLAASADGGTEPERPAAVLSALDEAADLLANTRATAREFYVHPGLIRAYEAGALRRLIGRVERERRTTMRPGYRKGEPLFLALLPLLASFIADEHEDD